MKIKAVWSKYESAYNNFHQQKRKLFYMGTCIFEEIICTAW